MHLRCAAVVGLVCALAAPAQAQTVGTKFAKLETVAAVFTQVCVNTVPSYRHAEQALKANRFVQAQTGTYFHPKFAVSYKIVRNKSCSVVVQVRGEATRNVKRFVNAMRPYVDIERASFNVTPIQSPTGDKFLAVHMN